jgi:hypothetical protein
MKTLSSQVKLLVVFTVGAAVTGAALLWNCWQSPRVPVGSGSVSERDGVPAIAKSTPIGNATVANSAALPPRERITNETRHAVEEAAAWREKLKTGDQTTLPVEAYPAGVVTPKQSAR